MTVPWENDELVERCKQASLATRGDQNRKLTAEQLHEVYVRAALRAITENRCPECGGEGVIQGNDPESGMPCAVGCDECVGSGQSPHPPSWLPLEQVGWHDKSDGLVYEMDEGIPGHKAFIDWEPVYRWIGAT